MSSLNETIAKFAESDLRIARTEGEMIIAQTKLGNLTVSYDKATRLYSVRNFNTAQLYLAGVKKAQAKTFIASNYSVEPEVGPEKSAGHVGFSGTFEYFWRNGNLYRANLNNPIFPDGYRCGRFESNVHNAAYFLKQAGLA